jgi:YihY family inner membrane protein
MLAALKRFYVKAYEDGITGLAGMVAYNLVLSLLPLTLLILFVAGRLLRTPSIEMAMIDDLHSLLPGTQDANLTGLFNGIRQSSATIGVAALISTVWVGASFWGALDTAFCRIYHRPCRSWLRQKRFALAMLLVSLSFLAAIVLLPALQSVVVAGAQDLPLGLDNGRTVYAIGFVAGLLLLFVTLSVVFRAVPHGPIPWRAIWPGAAATTLAVAVVDYAFPLYLSSGTTLTSAGGTYVFILIVLVWFYVLALILLGGAVLNALVLGPAPPDES